MTVPAVFVGNLLDGIHFEGQGGNGSHNNIYPGDGKWFSTLVLVVLETLESVLKYRN
jgi:hypothetical protein